MQEKEYYIFMAHETLTKYGLKRTKSRIAILGVLSKASLPMTAEDIFYGLKTKDINLSTVYRTLNSFVEAGLAKKEVNKNKENIFSLVHDEHDDHHVLVCVKCHKVVPLKGCPYHEANEAIENETGFAIEDHNTEIYGVCPDCQSKK